MKELNDIKTYYQEEQEEVEKQKSKAEDLFEYIKKDLETKAKAAIESSESTAAGLVEEARNRYPENLLAGFVEQFKGDAVGYATSANRWLLGLFFSFLTTLFIAFNFLGHFKIEVRQPSLGMGEELFQGILIISMWDFTIFVVVLMYWTAKRHLISWLKPSGITADVPNELIGMVVESARIALGFILILVPLYLVSIYFHITFETPSISAASFLIPNEEKINWAAMMSGIAPRIFVLALAATVTLFCARMYRIQKHLESVNQYRATALASFSIFVNSVGEENEETKARKDKIFDELASLIYAPIQTGFTEDYKLKTSDLANLVATATGKSGK